jgi:hypothetical protein
MRPSLVLFLLLGVLLLVDGGLLLYRQQAAIERQAAGEIMDIVVAGLGLTDLCVATEARYTRHPAVSDRAAPRMDHPGSIEHFPTGSFWIPPRL